MLKMLRKSEPQIDIADEMAKLIFPDPEPKIIQISEYYAGKISDLLSVERRNEKELVDIIASASERLRQTRLVIASLEPAQKALAGDVGV